MTGQKWSGKSKSISTGTGRGGHDHARPRAGAYSRAARMAARGPRATPLSRPARGHCRAQGARQSHAVATISTSPTFRARDIHGRIAAGGGAPPPGAPTSQERSPRARGKRTRRGHQPPLGCLLSMMSVTGPTLTRLTFIMLPKTHSVGRVRRQGDTRSNSNQRPESGQFCCARGWGRGGIGPPASRQADARCRGGGGASAAGP